ncbi:branched-chain amino acid aminotransferase [Mesobacillus subterraneus]|uniref:branched-chain amino acid aminotransferase n=1 Tax=Mesobacillus subterraneus TaxID=285983 RepID=UPI00203D647B|nr:branched-chain amino acid aminotransferase [Mesobacillus subterraneus]MCM3664176.1 branched-chain amino acid aminotransferase [Mesobacillus subterraneus]MCM3682204.1 branched-chain amino acid aminotransferase [Mesobacillus subterraneus]
MLKKQVEDYISKASASGAVELHPEEKAYAERLGLLQGVQVPIKESSGEHRFEKAYIERGNKETEEFLGEESSEFLKQPISYFKERKNEFMYMESEWFEMVRVDAVSFENDDVFGAYDVMLGLKLQKKFEPVIKSYLKENLQDDGYDLMFDGNEGIWSLNFALNGLGGYKEDLTVGEAYGLIYSFLFELAEWVESKQ